MSLAIDKLLAEDNAGRNKNLVGSPRGDISHPHVDKLAEDLAQDRKNLVCAKAPFSVTKHFVHVLVETIYHYTIEILKNPITQFAVIPMVLLYVLGRTYPGDHTQYLTELEHNIEFVIWWTGLGILSSVGLGTGMHSGILFLFPFIINTTLAAYECQSLNFNNRDFMWFGGEDVAFKCPDDKTPGLVTFWGILFKVLPATVLWGTGTAVGEIPPYAISRAAKLAGIANAEMEEIEELDPSNLFNRMKIWMIDFLQRHGFWGVLAFSAWPNMAFDLCGICCGHFLMPFWTFFGATAIGKAAIKAPMQAVFFVSLFSDNFVAKIISFLESASWLFAKISLPNPHIWAQEVINSVKEKYHKGNANEQKPNALGTVWGFIMVAFIGWFALSCVEQFAQQRAAKQDKAKLDAIRAKLE